MMLQHVHFMIYKKALWPSTGVPCDELTVFPRGTVGVIDHQSKTKLCGSSYSSLPGLSFPSLMALILKI